MLGLIESLTPGAGGLGEYSTKFNTEGLHPKVYHFDRRGTPFGLF